MIPVSFLSPRLLALSLSLSLLSRLTLLLFPLVTLVYKILIDNPISNPRKKTKIQKQHEKPIYTKIVKQENQSQHGPRSTVVLRSRGRASASGHFAGKEQKPVCSRAERGSVRSAANPLLLPPPLPGRRRPTGDGQEALTTASPTDGRRGVQTTACDVVAARNGGGAYAKRTRNATLLGLAPLWAVSRVGHLPDHLHQAGGTTSIPTPPTGGRYHTDIHTFTRHPQVAATTPVCNSHVNMRIPRL